MHYYYSKKKILKSFLRNIFVHIKTYIFKPCTTDRGEIDTFLVVEEKAAVHRRHDTSCIHTRQAVVLWLLLLLLTTGVYRVCGSAADRTPCAAADFSRRRRACVQGSLYECVRVHSYCTVPSLSRGSSTPRVLARTWLLPASVTKNVENRILRRRQDGPGPGQRIPDGR